jgi:hypothetical protein
MTSNSIQDLQRLAGLPAGETLAPVGPDEELVKRSVVGHTDAERDGVIKELAEMGRNAMALIQLAKTLPADADFPYWWTGKLREASKSLRDIHRYLENELITADHIEEPVEPVMESRALYLELGLGYTDDPLYADGSPERCGHLDGSAGRPRDACYFVYNPMTGMWERVGVEDMLPEEIDEYHMGYDNGQAGAEYY